MNSILSFLSSLVVPRIAYADVENIQGLVDSLIKISVTLVPLIMTLAALGLMWGIIRYIWGRDAKQIQEARQYVVWSIVGIAVMMSIWGLALFLKNSLFPNAPCVF